MLAFARFGTINGQGGMSLSGCVWDFVLESGLGSWREIGIVHHARAHSDSIPNNNHDAQFKDKIRNIYSPRFAPFVIPFVAIYIYIVPVRSLILVSAMDYLGHCYRVLITCFVGLTYSTKAQSSCPPLTSANLGSMFSLSTNGLLARSLFPADARGILVPVKINSYSILCDASGIRRNTSSYVSVLVQFQCSFPSGTGSLAQCDGMTNITRQYQYRCSTSNMWVNGGVVETLNPSATFQTEPNNQCRLCDDPMAFPGSPIDQVTHCLCKYISGNKLHVSMDSHDNTTLLTACNLDQCNQGQGRCYIENDREVCCNFYLENVCVAECPEPLMWNNDTFDCGELH